MDRDLARAQATGNAPRLMHPTIHSLLFSLYRTFPAKGRRFYAIGTTKGEHTIIVIFAPLGDEAVSVISMRPASRDERKLT